MNFKLKKGRSFNYLEQGEGYPIIVLHGIMGGLSNFDGVIKHFPEAGYKVLIPELPLYTLPVLRTNVRSLAIFLKRFISYLGHNKVILLGNSLGGHIALYYTKHFPDKVGGLVLSGSSGLYENSMGESYPRRGSYEYIQRKCEEVFYDPAVATKDIVDQVYHTINDRNKLIRTISIAKSAIRHNMAKDLPTMNIPACIIWGKNDIVTPPVVAEDFHKLLPDADLRWIDKCGHAPMMERPDEFNQILESWLISRNFNLSDDYKNS